jgi:hypothetical protein
MTTNTKPRTDAPAGLRAYALFNTWTGEQAPQSYEVRTQYRATRAEAEADAAAYPKGARLRVISFNGGYGATGEQNWTVYYAGVRIELAANGTNGGINETGVKRLHQIERAAAKLGQDIVWDPALNGGSPRNAYHTREALAAGLAAQAAAVAGE